MKNITIEITGQYKNSNMIVTGNKKNILSFLRDEARTKRRESRLTNKLEDHVGGISRDLHPSKLVTMASYHLMKKGVKELLELLNDHGVLKYDYYKI